MVPQAPSPFWHQHGQRKYEVLTGLKTPETCAPKTECASLCCSISILKFASPQVINIARRRKKLWLIFTPEGMEISQLQLHLVQTIMKNVFFSNFQYRRVKSEAEQTRRCCPAAGGTMLPIRPAAVCKLNRTLNERGKQQQWQTHTQTG